MNPFDALKERLLQIDGVEESTIMRKPCLRFNGDFLAMYLEKNNAIVIKTKPQLVKKYIDQGIASPFNITGRNFKEWIQLDQEFHNLAYDIITESIQM
ncbi:hypothetical protein [Tenuifilum thalassicum]|uniref:TfoX/Sxy family protein n=1 Tax=Tenuifilum thalassicum TaxID=2590900 RepID=A0A7D3XH87_9BACT|nr:hypothetical protein [Tenuifilum thalassicum]QKG80457.1 hypothetical protein FHG85_09330 [Tenuifilum thalassicum]